MDGSLMPQRLLGLLRQAKVVGVLRASSAEMAVEASLAAARGGLQAIELTFTTPDAAKAIEALHSQLPNLLLGAGSVMNGAQAEAAIRAGASFLVSPHLSEEVLRTARKFAVPYIPGVLTPNEIVWAQSLGCEILKIFPIGSSGGLAYLKDLRGPFPDLKVMVTGGVAPHEVPAYLSAGAAAVGLGSQFFPKVALETGDWTGIEAATRAALISAGVSNV
jgi:2-dehydro-3-deoxyphosphogluconate aldolase / (4S)-4-hydroxy-2-oxoglutarate aldolase